MKKYQIHTTYPYEKKSDMSAEKEMLETQRRRDENFNLNKK